LGSQHIQWIGEERWIDESCQIILNWFLHPLCHKPPNWKKQMASNDIVNFMWPQSWDPLQVDWMVQNNHIVNFHNKNQPNFTMGKRESKKI